MIRPFVGFLSSAISAFLLSEHWDIFLSEGHSVKISVATDGELFAKYFATFLATFSAPGTAL